MTVTFDLPQPVEKAYRKLAAATGVPVETLFREVVIAGQPSEEPESVAIEDPEEWLREFSAWTSSHTRQDLPLLPDEAISRDFIYRERGL